MNRPTATLRVPWAGPAVLSVLIALATTPRTAIATSPAPPVAAVTAVTAVTAAVPCWQEALAYVEAWKEYIQAWQDYQNSLPGGTEQEIMSAARRLDQAANKVADAGWRLVKCLASMTSSGPITY